MALKPVKLDRVQRKLYSCKIVQDEICFSWISLVCLPTLGPQIHNALNLKTNYFYAPNTLYYTLFQIQLV
jgi:hypothetical protein